MSKAALISVAVDADSGYRGNISAVVEYNRLPSDEEMQNIASDFNQPATTFLKRTAEGEYAVRWFAPDAEIGLCGHGSLAAAAFLQQERVILRYRKGVITVGLKNGRCTMETEAILAEKQREVPEVLKEGTGITLSGYFMTGNKHIVLAEKESDVRNMKPDFHRLKQYEEFGFIVTAPADQPGVDFVSRTLVPHVQQLEDHATGSSHAALTPFWANRLNKTKLTGHQLSKRGGAFLCTLKEDKVALSTDYRVVMAGDL